MMKINVNLHPKDGYFFVESDGARIRGTSWGGVIARVRAYRARNHLAPGDPETEVHAQACIRNPNLCSSVDAATIQARKVVSLKGRMLSWLNFIRKNRDKEPLNFVSAEEQKRRADICAHCPMNTPLKEGCSACRMALAEIRLNVIGHRPVDGRINGCLVTGEDLVSSVWIDQATLDLPTAPQACWRKRTL